ncbi:hypothetical protein acsn021_26260 [Anaerocolumna cellulosilytica]|uniref:Uncharacterized protein n=1 Tax=Anaerocolumna cellulosilytica TaxID=433286 RepID=A0A6S6R4R3_9FIRM|nr:gamma-mobile-trio protein GmtX [Anaerocolumna cellulosilytica]MBB5193726.1 hypothetical protein [Anaerocolumna cellulosilytica]BCJ95057.1 hypothetical protein acsn021_26260 [Anaerocolumna cellulosilytica]
MVNMHPDELFSQLYENASTRKKKTLELIHDTCRKQSESNVKDFSLGTIARLIADECGPSEQGLRNKNAGDYRALINLWAVYSNTTTKKPKKEKTSTINDDILASVSDPTTRALVGMLIAENKKLKRENSLLKEQTTLTIDMRPNKDSNNLSNQNVVVVSASHDLTETELTALRDAISDEFMKHMGWTSDTYGRVKEKGMQIYKPGYISAIKKVLKRI